MKHLDRFEASRACLTTVGFREETTADGTAQLTLPRERVSRPILSAVSALLKGELHMLDVQKRWPSALRATLPAAATALALRPALLDALTVELVRVRARARARARVGVRVGVRVRGGWAS